MISNYKAAQLAKFAYHKKKGSSFNYAGTRGFYLESHKRFVVSVAGTETFQDWITNMIFENRLAPNIIRTGDPNLKIHTGFKLKAWAIQTSEIAIHLIKAIEEGKEIYFIGHSAGAATAAFLSLWAKEILGADEVFLYAFGCPRIGEGRVYDRLYDLCNCYFFRHSKDLVPFLPLPFPRNYRAIKLKSPGKWRNVIRNHSIEEYIESLR